MTDVTIEKPDLPAPPLRGVSILAWFMMVAGALTEFPLLKTLPALPSHAEWREGIFLGICIATAVLVFGYGLQTRVPWAWEGTINLAWLLILGGLLLPLAMIDAHEITSTIAGGAILGGLVIGAGLGVITVLAQPNVRRAFEWSGLSGLRAPSIWIRLIAMGDVSASLFEISNLLRSRPRLVFGFAMTGVPLIMYRVALAGLFVYVGQGLYRLNSSVRRLAIGFSIYMVAEILVWSIVTPTPQGGFSFMRAAGCLIGAALSGLIVWYLAGQRQFFSNQPC